MIKTPNYPLPYPDMIDCRWLIKVDERSQISIVFSSFQTQDRHDLVYVGRFFQFHIDKIMVFKIILF